MTSKNKFRVGVLMGGRSIEREVSFNSGRTICDHLDVSKYEIIPIFQTHFGDLYILPWHFLHRGKISDFFDRLEKEAKKIDWDDLKKYVDFIYLAIHGRFAEDGTVQGFLEVLQIPYLGSKVFSSALGMNKIMQKKFLKSFEIDIPKDIVVKGSQLKNLSIEDVLIKLYKEKINFPCVVKPVHEGSSFGVSVVEKKDDLFEAIKTAACCDSSRVQNVLIEEKIEGMEFVVVSLQNNKPKNLDDWFSLSVTQVNIEKDSKFYDYIQKYMPGRATKITPARCSKKYYDKIIKTCLEVTKILNMSTISRIDGFLTNDGRVVIVDPNSLTGMAPSTFLFHQAAEIGMSHTDLINYLIDVELCQYGIQNIVLNNSGFKGKVKVEEQKIKVVVLFGGNTNEKEISLESGRNICYKLSPQKYEFIPVFVNNSMELFKLSQKLLVQNSTREISKMVTDDQKIKWSSLPKICDFVFIALHGGVGENGSVQGILEMLGLPYNGSGVLTSALCMDKFKTSQFLSSQGFNVPKSFLVDKQNFKKFYKDNKNKLSFPLILKPHNDGCSVFVKKIKCEKDLEKELDFYFKESGKKYVLIEECVAGIELTCGVIGNDKVLSLPPSKVFAGKDVLSIEEKFLPGQGENLTPAPLPKNVLILVKKTMEEVYKSLNCKGYARIDFFYQDFKISPIKKDRIIILEVNSLPGMTPATCLFHQAAEIGLKPMEFIDKIVEFGFENHKIFSKKNLEKEKWL
ncbi:ATP-grasp domain-containing protein [Candidatus Babeliales bacterium]|nr:ATP-grasp domain-containing protein [Candidatus Babeliales bacterium]